jgi:hypothetical protein
MLFTDNHGITDARINLALAEHVRWSQPASATDSRSHRRWTDAHALVG